MTIETNNGQRVLTPSENMWLYNDKAQVISDKVYLGKGADESDWTEITDERKQELEVMWHEGDTDGDIIADGASTIEDYQKAQAYDIIVGGAE